MDCGGQWRRVGCRGWNLVINAHTGSYLPSLLPTLLPFSPLILASYVAGKGPRRLITFICKDEAYTYAKMEEKYLSLSRSPDLPSTIGCSECSVSAAASFSIEGDDGYAQFLGH